MPLEFAQQRMHEFLAGCGLMSKNKRKGRPGNRNEDSADFAEPIGRRKVNKTENTFNPTRPKKQAPVEDAGKDDGN